MNTAEPKELELPVTTPIDLDAAMPILQHAEAKCQRQIYDLLLELYGRPDTIPPEWTERLRRLILASRHLGHFQGLITERTRPVTLNIEKSLVDDWTKMTQDMREAALEAGRNAEQEVANG